MSKILVVLEGEKLDVAIINSLVKHYEFRKRIEIQIYKTDIYSLYSELKKEFSNDMEDIDIVTILRNRDTSFNFRKNDFTEIYLFFDYDRHSRAATDEKIRELIGYFSEETEKGKIYINYPMVESFFHIDFGNIGKYRDVQYEIKKGYKSESEINSMTSIHEKILLDREKIHLIFKQNILKTNFIVNSEYSFIDYSLYSEISQGVIFENQYEKYVLLSNSMGVLSNFPNFIVNYFGESVYKNIIKKTRN